LNIHKIKCHLVGRLHFLFIPFDIELEVEDDGLLLFVHKKEEIKDGYFDENEIHLLEHNQIKGIKICYDNYHEMEKENN